MNRSVEQILGQSQRLLLIVVAAFFLNADHSTSVAEPLLLVGQAVQEATFISAAANNKLRFQWQGEMHTVRLNDMVRWSTQRNNTERSELLLDDGSRLVLAESWTGEPSWQLKDASITVTTQLFGKVELQRGQVRAVLLHAPQDLKQRRKFVDRLLKPRINDEADRSDALVLTNGDQWQGQVVRLVKHIKGLWRIDLLPDSAKKPLHLPESRVAAILFGHREANAEQQKILQIGLRDGSLLTATSLAADDDQLRVRLACGVELTGPDRREVAHLRSLTAPCTYLSDLVPTDYQHVPYLKIPWPFHVDRNVLGGPLQHAGSHYAKGLGMLTATRLTYSLETKAPIQRFVTTVAIDDEAVRRGSVVFRVYLKSDGDWQQAFASPVVRGGDPPLPVTVGLGDAKELALVTDFADRGDECDYANWLDARLE